MCRDKEFACTDMCRDKYFAQICAAMCKLHAMCLFAITHLDGRVLYHTFVGLKMYWTDMDGLDSRLLCFLFFLPDLDAKVY